MKWEKQYRYLCRFSKHDARPPSPPQGGGGGIGFHFVILNCCVESFSISLLGCQYLHVGHSWTKCSWEIWKWIVLDEWPSRILTKLHKTHLSRLRYIKRNFTIFSGGSTWLKITKTTVLNFIQTQPTSLRQVSSVNVKSCLQRGPGPNSSNNFPNHISQDIMGKRTF